MLSKNSHSQKSNYLNPPWLLEQSFVAFDEIVHMESTLAHQMKKTHARDALSHGTDVPSHGTVLNTDTVIL